MGILWLSSSVSYSLVLRRCSLGAYRCAYSSAWWAESSIFSRYKLESTERCRQSYLVATLAGMISLSLIVDKFGIFQAPQRPVRLVQVAGVVVILLGVVLIRLTF